MEYEFAIVGADGADLDVFNDAPTMVSLPNGDHINMSPIPLGVDLGQGVKVVKRQKAGPTLGEVKAFLSGSVQSGFDAACATIITPGSAMASVYRQLVEDAAKVIIDNSQKPDSIVALIGAYGANNVEVATAIMQRDKECIAAMARLNGKRTFAKLAIAAAQDEATARAAAQVDWSS